MDNKISVVINTRNEESVLPRVLSSVQKFANEIIVADMHSDDSSAKIARQFGARVFDIKPSSYVEPARNLAVKSATGPWILVLDPDEEMSITLKRKLKKIANNPASLDYYRLPRKNIIFGKWMKHSRWWPDYNIRFFKKGSVEWSNMIHGIPITIGEGKDLLESEENAIIHHHYESIEQFILRMNRYTNVQAKSRIKDKYKFNWTDLIKKPSGEFLSRYFYGQGYKDGLHGLAMASLQSFSELVLYLKIWQLQGAEQSNLKLKEVISQMRKSEREHHYWQADSLISEGGGIINRIKRKFKL